MPGPARIPNEIKRKRGTLRADRAPKTGLEVSLEPAEITPAPQGLGLTGAAAWEKISQHAASWLAASDREALMQLCQTLDFHAQLTERIAADGPVLLTDKGYAYPHPAVGMRATAEESIRKWMAQLGLTPADRAKLGLAMVESVSAVEKYRRRLAQGDGRHAG